jgi:hypothetical protein
MCVGHSIDTDLPSSSFPPSSPFHSQGNKRSSSLSMKDSSEHAINGLPTDGPARQQRRMEKPIPIAIIGMACRLPGEVSDLASFWDFCLEARSSWAEFSPKRLNTAAFYHPNAEKPGCVSLTPCSHDGKLTDQGRVVPYQRSPYATGQCGPV